MHLPARHAAALGHGSVLLLEAVSEALGALEVLVDAPRDAALLAGSERLGGKVVDAVIEAALDEVGVHLEAQRMSLGRPRGVWIDVSATVFHLTFINSFICLRSMRFWSSRCSAPERLALRMWSVRVAASGLGQGWRTRPL